MASDRRLVVLLGPTGVGKTRVGVELAKRYNAPILSADSRQFYREMAIGTAAPTPLEMQGVTHHLLAHRSIHSRYSCGMFEQEALQALGAIFATGRVALLVGGSMLYIDAVCRGIDDFPPPDMALRRSLQAQLAREGVEGLRAQLKRLDPAHYARVDLRNPQRVLKAVEVCLQTGRTFSSFLSAPARDRPFGIIKIGLNRPREELYRCIDRRVDDMVAQGLVDEAQGLYPFRGLNALKTVGYRELFDHFEGRTSLEQAVELIKRNTRRYAKRQLTWWARDPAIAWFAPEDLGGITGYLDGLLGAPTGAR